MAEPLLNVKSLNTELHTRAGVVHAVRDVSFTLDPADTLAIVGESGSGKSMTCLSILGLLPEPYGRIASGEVSFNGENIIGASKKRLRQLRGDQICMVFQDPVSSLNPFLTISTQLMEGYLTHHKVEKSDAWKRAVEVLGLVGIPEPESRMRAYPHELSGGMRQRVVIAIALMGEPQLLIADEPTSALDVTIQAQIIALLKELQHRFNMSLIMVTHDLGLVANSCRRVAVMYAGRIVEQGEVRDIFAHPRHPYTIGLLKSIPSMTSARDRPLQTIEGSPPSLIGTHSGCPFYERCSYRVDECRQKLPEYRSAKEGHTFACIKDIHA